MQDDQQSIEIRCPDCGTLLREQSHVRGEFTTLHCSCCATLFHLAPVRGRRRTGELLHAHGTATTEADNRLRGETTVRRVISFDDP
jgi:hypothetical protein